MSQGPNYGIDHAAGVSWAKKGQVQLQTSRGSHSTNFPIKIMVLRRGRKTSERKLARFVSFLILGTCLVVVACLPWMRNVRWRETHRSTQDQVYVRSSIEIQEEDEIRKAVERDVSQLDHGLGIRTIRRVPTTKIELEAAFRQRLHEAALMLVDSEPLFVLRYAPYVPVGDEPRERATRALAMRRPVISTGLEMRDSDISTLPWVSRSTILSYIQGHYVSLQATVMKDRQKNGRWHLHHRPVAAVAKFGGASLTEPFVSPVTESVADIRGLGVYRAEPTVNEPDTVDETAFGYSENTRLKRYHPFGSIRLCLVRATGDDSDPNRFRIVLTDNQFQNWHCLVDSEITRSPRRPNDASSLGTIHITEYNGMVCIPRRAPRDRSKSSRIGW